MELGGILLISFKKYENMKEKRESKKYLFLILVLIAILSFRILNQGKSVNRMLEEDRSLTGISFEDREFNFQKEKESSNKTYTSPQGDLTFEYSSEWTKTEDEKILNLFKAPKNQDEYLQKGLDEYDYGSEIKNLEEFDQKIGMGSDEEELYGEIVFLATRVVLPNFSFGVASLQDLKLENKSSEELKDIMMDELSQKDENSEVKITNLLVEDYFVLIETKTLINGRTVFKSKNLGLAGEASYVFTFSSAYETWSDLENEFNKIISSISFDDSNQ